MEHHIIENDISRKDSDSCDLVETETTADVGQTEEVKKGSVEKIAPLKNIIENVMRKNAVPPLIVYPCPKCNSVFSSERSLNGHKHKHSEKPDVPFCCCIYCRKEFRYLGRFKNHVKKHQSDKIVRCSPCGKKFYSQANLNRHVKAKHVKVKLSFKKVRKNKENKK